MSDCVRALVWSHYNKKRFGAPRILAVALSDEADDLGGGIFQSISKLAKKTEQTERAVRGQLRNMESAGLLKVREKSAGGPGQFHHYELDLAVLIGASNPERGSGLTRNEVPGYEPPNPEAGSGLAGPLYKVLKEDYVEDASSFRVTDDAEDRRLAEWIYARLKSLNPKHRMPSWAAWCKDIRLMRERDQRTRREIGALFAFANADPFWQANILSPGTLRKQWDRLVMKRLSNGGGAGVQAPRQPDSGACSFEHEDVRCTKPAVFFDREGRGLCRACREIVERKGANGDRRRDAGLDGQLGAVAPLS